MAEPGRPPRRGRGAPPGPDDFSLPLPQQTAVRVPAVPRDKSDNVGLWIDKLIPLQKRTWELKKEHRDVALGALCRGKWTSTAGAEAQRRQEEMIDSLHGVLWRGFRARINGRLLIDYGGASTVETTLSFHRIWGVPRIAGSALKGVVKTLLTDEGEDPRRVERLLGEDTSRDRIGQAGQATFYDALPQGGSFGLGLDVLTPHYPDYYGNGKKEPPGEWQDPVPFTFLTVVNTEFVFHMGLSFLPEEERGAPEAQRQGDLDWLGAALKRALEQYGVGAKTSAGYGRFEGFVDVRRGEP